MDLCQLLTFHMVVQDSQLADSTAPILLNRLVGMKYVLLGGHQPTMGVPEPSRGDHCQPSQGGVPECTTASSCVFLVPVERGPGRDACSVHLQITPTFGGKHHLKNRTWLAPARGGGCGLRLLVLEGVLLSS